MSTEESDLVVIRGHMVTPHQGRIDPQAIGRLLQAVSTEFFAAAQGQSVDTWLPLQVDVALIPPDLRFIQIHAPASLPALEKQSLREQLGKMKLPYAAGAVALVWVASREDRESPVVIQSPLTDFGWAPGRDLAATLQKAADASYQAPPTEAEASLPVPHQSGLADAAASSIPPSPFADETIQQLSELSAEELDARLQQAPESPDALFARGTMRSERGQWREALQDFDRLATQLHDNPHVELARGEAYLRLEESGPSLESFSRVIEASPKWAAGYSGRGRVYMMLQAWEPAVRDFAAALACEPLSAEAHLLRAMAHWNQGERPKALADLNQALRLDPYHPAALLCRIDSLALTLASESAESEPSPLDYIADLEHALRYGPHHPRCLARLAEIRLRSGDLKAALDLSNRALELDPDCGPAFGIRGCVHFLTDEFDQSFEDLTRAIELDAGAAPIFTHRATIHLTRDEFESSLRDVEQALELDRDFAPAYDVRALARSKLSDHPGAETDLEKASELAPRWSLPLIHLGELRMSQKNYASAREAFSRAIDCDPEIAFVWLQRAQCWFHEQDVAQAQADVHRAVELDPELEQAYGLQASIHLSRHEFREAIAALDQLIARDPENPAALFQRAHAWLHLEDFVRARQDFDAVIELCPSLAAAYSGRGHAWIQVGEQDKAAEDFREAISCEPAQADTLEMHRLLAQAAYHHRREQFDQAIELASESLELDAANRTALAVRAAAYWYDEQYVEAIEDYGRILQQDDGKGSRFSALSSRGQVHVESGDYEAGLMDLNEALSQGQQETRTHLAYALSGRALAHAGLEHLEEARADFAASIRDCPENAWVHYNHGRVYDKLGEPLKAAHCFELALALDEPSLTPRKRARAQAYVHKHLPEADATR